MWCVSLLCLHVCCELRHWCLPYYCDCITSLQVVGHQLKILKLWKIVNLISWHCIQIMFVRIFIRRGLNFPLYFLIKLPVYIYLILIMLTSYDFNGICNYGFQDLDFRITIFMKNDFSRVNCGYSYCELTKKLDLSTQYTHSSCVSIICIAL